jgi:hypothetical protein
MRPGPSPFALFRSAGRANKTTWTSRRTISTPRLGEIDMPPPPRMSKRLRPLLPFFFWWSVITSLAVHRLQLRQRAEIELGVVNAKITVLDSLIKRTQAGEVLDDEQVQRELEMVGLKERKRSSEVEGAEREIVKDVTWKEALFGRKRQRGDLLDKDQQAVVEPKTEAEEVQEWADGMS